MRLPCCLVAQNSTRRNRYLNQGKNVISCHSVFACAQVLKTIIARAELSLTLPPIMCTLVNQLLSHSLSYLQGVTVPSCSLWFSPFWDTSNKEVLRIGFKKKTVTLPGRQVHGGVTKEVAKQATKDLLYLQKNLFR